MPINIRQATTAVALSACGLATMQAGMYLLKMRITAGAYPTLIAGTGFLIYSAKLLKRACQSAGTDSQPPTPPTGLIGNQQNEEILQMDDLRQDGLQVDGAARQIVPQLNQAVVVEELPNPVVIVHEDGLAPMDYARRPRSASRCL